MESRVVELPPGLTADRLEPPLEPWRPAAREGGPERLTYRWEMPAREGFPPARVALTGPDEVEVRLVLVNEANTSRDVRLWFTGSGAQVAVDPIAPATVTVSSPPAGSGVLLGIARCLMHAETTLDLRLTLAGNSALLLEPDCD